MKNEEFEKELFEIYLDSLEDRFDFDEDKEKIESLTTEAGEANIIVEENNIEPIETQVLGTIRQLSHSGKLINYVPIAGYESQSFYSLCTGY